MCGVALALLACLALPASAQVVRGVLVSSGDERPVTGAFVILEGEDGLERTRVRTDGRGRYLITVPEAGVYALRTAVIGLRSWVSPPVTVGASDTVDVRIALRMQSVRLDSIIVTGDRACRADPTGGAQTLAVWSEARKALEAVQWAERSDSLWYHVLHYERVLNRGSLRPIQGSARRMMGTAPAGPFQSADADDLSARGYVQAQDGGWRPYGPDANVLLSETFAADHCFYLRDHPRDSTAIGVAFEPARGRTLPDIEGVFWLDRVTAGLRSLEFRYRALPWPIASEHIGGEIGFRQMSNGLWVVEDWRLRLPELRRVGSSLVGDVAVTRFQETGGMVVQLRGMDGTVLTPADAVPIDTSATVDTPPPVVHGVLRGTVADSSTGGPVDGAAVLLLDEYERVHDVAFTSAFGWFELQAPEAGRFRLNLHRRGYLPSGSPLMYLGDGRVIDTESRLVRLGSEDPDAAGFRRRRENAITLHGFDVAEIAEIAEIGAASVLDVLVSIPGVRGHPRSRDVVHLNDRACAPTVLIDGVPTASPAFLRVPLEGWVAAVEVFLQSKDTPLEFTQGARPSASACGTVAIWTTSLMAVDTQSR